MLQVHKAIVSAKWLQQHLENQHLVVLNATLIDFNELAIQQIPKSRFFDIKQKFSDVTSSFPNTCPSSEQFTCEAQELGINNDSCIVVYDEKGIFSSARVWWLFKAFGYTNVAVLNGGLPEWQNQGFPTEKISVFTGDSGNFTANYQPGYMKFFNDIVTEIDDDTHTIIDARSESRFKGLVTETRPGLRSGHIPNSKNLPYESLLNNGILNDDATLKASLQTIAQPEDQITFSCGSGITACILALSAEISGYKHISVYDGSWTEWGTLF